MNENVYVGLRKATRNYNDGFQCGWEVTDKVIVDGVTFFEITHWSKFPEREELTYFDSSFPVEFSYKGCGISAWVSKANLASEIAKRKLDGGLPVQIDFHHYLGIA